MLDELKSGVGGTKAAFKETKMYDEIMDRLADTKKDLQFKSVIKDTKDNFHKYLPRMAAGGVTGAIMSGVLGLVGGPLLGAAGGAAIELVKNSTRLQSFLLGDEIVSKDENGNITRSRDYNSGKLPTKVSAAIDKVECPSKNGVSFNSVSRKLDINCIDEKESEHKNMLLRWTAWLFLLIFGIPITICLILELML